MPTSTVSGTALTGLYAGGGGGGGNGVYYAGTGTATWSTTTAMLTPSGQIELKGDQADVVINGVSLNDTLKLIQDRLCMLRLNPELEQEWDQLRDLGEQYRELEAQLKEKQRAWEILKKQG